MNPHYRHCQRVHSRYILALSIFVLSACASFPKAKDGTIYRSRDGERTARVEGATLYVDGRAQQLAFDAIARFGLMFSLDGKRFGYIGIRDDKVYPVIDGVEFGAFETYPVDNAISFSSGGESWAFFGIRNGKWMMLTNGVDSRPYDGLAAPVFSPDGARVAYSASIDGKWSVVVDGKESGKYDGILAGSPVFSPDGARVAYGALIDGMWSIVVDGKESGKYDGILAGSPVFSPDGARVAYGALIDGMWSVVADGVASEPYEGLIGVDFAAPDRLVYGEKSGTKWTVHADGAAVNSYDGIATPGVVFSPDRSRNGYFGIRDNRMVAVVDGDEALRSYMRIGSYTAGVDWSKLTAAVLTNVAINALTVPLGFLVVTTNGSVREASDMIPLRFSPDSRHFAYVAYNNERGVVIVDGEESRELPVGRVLDELNFGESSSALIYRLSDGDSMELIDLSVAPPGITGSH